MTGTSIYRWRGTLQSNGEIWQARREYETCMDLSGSQATSYVELAGAYIKTGLLKPAKEVIKKAWSLLNDAPEIIRLKTILKQK
jgi:Flp pilus assembly protein TadD